MHTSDGHIVHQCLSGNTEAFALLVDKYKERIFALVYAKVGQFQDAEDLTQDVFLNAYKKTIDTAAMGQLLSVALFDCRQQVQEFLSRPKGTG